MDWNDDQRWSVETQTQILMPRLAGNDGQQESAEAARGAADRASAAAARLRAAIRRPSKEPVPVLAKLTYERAAEEDDVLVFKRTSSINTLDDPQQPRRLNVTGSGIWKFSRADGMTVSLEEDFVIEQLGQSELRIRLLLQRIEDAHQNPSPSKDEGV